MTTMWKVSTIGALLAAASVTHAESDAQFKLRFFCQLDGASAGAAVTSMRDKGVELSTLIATMESESKAKPEKAALFQHQKEVVRYVSKALNEDKARNEKHDASWYAAEVAALCVSFGGADSKYLDAKVVR
ncbi:hypothetical protein AWB80_02914 [Caballeronia pedi]|uniref:Uncharacterized protein n=1 Tax=Caballeronia pedi TaxID=1777141 RepID=A0A158B367_9BURK|nr:hypothetical protein [Caballeronia pedi]SAK63747.1 hypothetical protein AWB80_02914 [Caballeronia pedi]